MWYLESHSLLSPTKYGFRRSTADPLAHFETQITSAFVRHDSVLAVFDLEKAQYTTQPHILQQFFLLIVLCVKFTSSTSFPQFSGVLGTVPHYSSLLKMDQLQPYHEVSNYPCTWMIQPSLPGPSVPVLSQLQSAITPISSQATTPASDFLPYTCVCVYYTT